MPLGTRSVPISPPPSTQSVLAFGEVITEAAGAWSLPGVLEPGATQLSPSRRCRSSARLAQARPRRSPADSAPAPGSDHAPAAGVPISRYSSPPPSSATSASAAWRAASNSSPGTQPGIAAWLAIT